MWERACKDCKQVPGLPWSLAFLVGAAKWQGLYQKRLESSFKQFPVKKTGLFCLLTACSGGQATWNHDMAILSVKKILCQKMPSIRCQKRGLLVCEGLEDTIWIRM